MHESKISDLNVELVEDPSGKCNCLEVSMQLSSGTSSPLHDLLGRTHSPTLKSPTSTHKNSSPIAKDSMARFFFCCVFVCSIVVPRPPKGDWSASSIRRPFGNDV